MPGTSARYTESHAAVNLVVSDELHVEVPGAALEPGRGALDVAERDARRGELGMLHRTWQQVGDLVDDVADREVVVVAQQAERPRRGAAVPSPARGGPASGAASPPAPARVPRSPGAAQRWPPPAAASFLQLADQRLAVAPRAAPSRRRPARSRRRRPRPPPAPAPRGRAARNVVRLGGLEDEGVGAEARAPAARPRARCRWRCRR